MPPQKLPEPDEIDEVPNDFDSASGEDEGDLKTAKYNQALTWATDWTAETVVHQLKKGVIELDPSFQRRDAWRPIRKSRFIESLILGLPIPQIVLAERKERRGNYFVIDGKQRLLTLKQFCISPEDGGPSGFKLGGLKVRATLNGLTYEELTNNPSYADEISAFHSQTIRTVVIKNWPNEDFLYTVFLRLNSNSVALSPQELRKALHPGPFLNYAEMASSNSKSLLCALGLKFPDFRMRDVEIVVRFYAFKRYIDKYNGNLKEFLDATCANLNKAWHDESEDIASEFKKLESAIDTTISIFGEDRAFRKFSGDRYERPLNRAVFDIFLFYFSREKYRERAIQQKNAVRKLFEELCTEDMNFIRSLETSTKTTEGVRRRFNTWGKELSRLLKIKFTSPFSE